LLERYIGGWGFVRSMLRLAIPIALQNLLITSFSLVDSIMVSSLGEESLAAVGFAATWNQYLVYLVFGLASGASVFIARFWGAGDLPGIRRTYGLALVGALAMGVLFCFVSVFFPARIMRAFTTDLAVVGEGAEYLRIIAFAYLTTPFTMVGSTVLRSTERVRLPLIASFCAVVTNVVLNYILIFGHFGAPRLELRGAAIASLVSAYVNILVLYGISFRQKNAAIAPVSELLSFNRAFVYRYIGISLPVFINELCWGTGRTVLMMIFGRQGTENFAALTALRTIEGMVMVWFIGLCTACGILVGKRLGTCDAEGAYEDSRRFSVWLFLLAVLCGVCMVILRAPVMSLFHLSGDSLRAGMNLMLLSAAEGPFRFYSYLLIVGVFRAGGDTKRCLYYELFCQWGISIPLAFLCGFVLRLPFLLTYFIPVCAESVIKSIICLRHFISRRWIHALEPEATERKPADP